jgi:hypothetical protein
MRQNSARGTHTPPLTSKNAPRRKQRGEPVEPSRPSPRNGTPGAPTPVARVRFPPVEGESVEGRERAFPFSTDRRILGSARPSRIITDPSDLLWFPF